MWEKVTVSLDVRVSAYLSDPSFNGLFEHFQHKAQGKETEKRNNETQF